MAQTPVTCSGPPIATGTVGTHSASAPSPEYVNNFGYWPGENYSFKVGTNFSASNKLSFGAASDARILLGGNCVTSGGACSSAYVGNRITTILMQNLLTTYGGQSTFITKMFLNGVKAAEFVGVSANSSISTSTQTFSDGIAVIRQDTGSNSRFLVEGWNNGVWKSVPWKVVSPVCGSVALAQKSQRDMLASVGFFPIQNTPRQWWEALI